MIRGLIFDLDGTVYSGEDDIPGAAEFIRSAHQRGWACHFVTNRANRPPIVVRDQLRLHGIACEVSDILTSAQATARRLGSGSAYIIGEAGLHEAFAEQGIRLTDQSPDYVVASFDQHFNYAKLKTACNLIHRGARFIATNPDKRLRDGDEILPGTGAIVAAIREGSGIDPIVIGKPERLIFDLALEAMGLPAEQVVAIGDNLDTDIAAGIAADMRTVLLLTGTCTRSDAERSPVHPTWIAENYAALQVLATTDEAWRD